MPLAAGRAYGVVQGNTRMLSGDYILDSCDIGNITADASTTQAGGTLLTHQLNVVASGGAGYSVVLPPANRGMRVEILLSTASNTCKVYPNAGGTTTEVINALSANAAITMSALTSATFFCVVAGQWYTSPRVPS